jgi:hypothetical protein
MELIGIIWDLYLDQEDLKVLKVLQDLKVLKDSKDLREVLV